MNNTPERIWVDYWMTGGKPRQITEEDLGGCTEYVRADLVRKLEADLGTLMKVLEVANKICTDVELDIDEGLMMLEQRVKEYYQNAQ